MRGISARVTRHGKELARVVAEMPGFQQEHYGELEQICSLIYRHSVTHQNLQVLKCDEPWTDWHEKREEQVESRISELCEMIPCSVKFGGDPRGFTVRLIGLGKWNTWGGEEHGYGVLGV